MRDLALALLLIGVFPLSVKRPLVGLCVYLIISIGVPHRLTFGFAYDFPWAQIFAIAVLASVIFRREYSLALQFNRWIIPLSFAIWTGITTAAAFSQDVAFTRWQDFLKVHLACLLILAIVRSYRDLIAVVASIALPIAFYGVKGAAFMATTGGEWRVFGPPESGFGDNNALALALIFVLPMLYWLFTIASNKYFKLILLGCIVGAVFSALGSYSRGGFLGLGVVLIAYFMRSNHRFRFAMLSIPLLVIALNFMPDKFWDRMKSIETYSSDNSSLERLNSWEAMYNIANANILGSGFSAYTNPASVIGYAPSLDFPVRAAHSIYFQVIGDHGWVGLFLYLACIALAFLQVQRFIKQAKSKACPERVLLGYALQASILAYCASGTFLSMSYWEAVWYIFAVCAVLKRLGVQETVSQSATKISGLSSGIAPTSRNRRGFDLQS
jgi:probable O-glycosylation ligase (exosortase A-associated)